MYLYPYVYAYRYPMAHELETVMIRRVINSSNCDIPIDRLSLSVVAGPSRGEGRRRIRCPLRNGHDTDLTDPSSVSCNISL
jgi:hypothetical protein